MKKGDRFKFGRDILEFKEIQVDNRGTERAVCFTVKRGNADLPMVFPATSDLKNIEIL